MTTKSLENIHAKMYEDLDTFDAKIDDLEFCPHKPDAGCSCRKPHPGMIIQLAKKHNIDVSKSYMVGDRKPDILAGQYAGTKTILVGKRQEDIEADYTFEDLLAFSNWFIK